MSLMHSNGKPDFLLNDVYKFEIWDSFIFSEHRGDKIDLQGLVVEWVAVAALTGLFWKALLGKKK